MGRDFECVFSDLNSKLVYVDFNGISTVTIYTPVTITGVQTTRTRRDGAYTLVQKVIGADMRIIKTTGTNFVLGAEIIFGPTFVGNTYIGDLALVEDSMYAI